MPPAPDTPPHERDLFVLWLAGRHPDLTALLDEHLASQGELLAHVFFGDVTRHYEGLCEKGRIAEAQALVGDIDAGLEQGDEWTDNLVHVSFLENLGREKNGVAWELLTPRLRAGFDTIHGHTAAP